MARRTLIVCAGLVLALAGAPLNAQFVRGTILGTVTDETGAVIPGARVTLKNLGTNEVKEAASDEVGNYIFPALLPGTYSIEVSRGGFKTQVVSNVKLEVNQTARVDIRLAVGEVVERVEATASALLLKTDTSEIGHVITNKQIVELPLNGRDYLQLARLIPGVAPSRAGATAGQKGVSRSVNAAGARDTSVSFLLDGVDTNDMSFQTPGVTPSIDAIQEFKVLQNAYTAEFGRGATQILTALKSGTNEWRGSLFEFLRNDKLASRSFFQPGKAAPLKQNQFGGTLGGPLILPRLYNGKDRTFFFVNYEGQRIRTGGTGFALVPTEEQRRGDFSAPGEPRIFDPLTFDSATRTRQQFAGNRVPASRISPKAVKIAELWPKPNYTGLVGRNFAGSPAQMNDNNQGNLRIDHRFGNKDSFFARYSALDRFRSGYSIIPLGGTVDDIRGQNVALNWVRTFTPALLNEVRVGLNRVKYLTPPEGSLGPNPAKDIFGFANTTVNPTTSFGLPQFGFSGGFAGLGPGSQFPQNAVTQTQQYVDNITWLRGAHSIKAGFDIRHTRLSQIVANNDRGTMSFTGQFTNLPGVSATGSSIAEMLLGFPYNAAAAAGDQVAHNLNEMFAFFLQDDWKVSSRLTLNLGVRYEYAPPWREKLDQFTVVDHDEALGRLLMAGTTKAFVPGKGIVDSGRAPLPRTVFDPDRNNWAPRVGFAFRPFGKTVLRGGYGIFHDVQEGNEAQFMRLNPPFFFVQNYLSDPFVPNIRLEALFPSPASAPSGVIQPFSVATGRTPYMQQWNLNIEREVAANLLVEIGYLGSKGTHLLRRTNFQQGPNILVKDPANPAPLRDRVRFPNFSPTVIIGTENGGSSTYHGLIAKVERRYTSGLAFLFSYTFSKAIDDSHSSSNFSGTPSNAQCRCDLRGNKGPSAFDITQRVVLSYGYELPFGKGKPFLNAGGALNKIVGGWQINGITSAQSGPPFQINTSGDNANIGTGAGSSNNQRPNVAGDQFAGIERSAKIQRRGVDQGTYYFNRAAYAMPPLFRLGNLGKNTIRGPGAHSWDFSALKNTAITERLNTQFRAEFFNVFNQTNFGLPGTLLNTPTFGIITGASGGRVIQFGLKLLF
ncbi:MAG: TonB-dependent receptor [Acidobacteriota bacterium]